MIRAGAAIRDITPRDRMHLGGYLPTREWVGVHDPLTVRALALEDGTTRIVLLALDSIGILKPDADRVRAQVAQATATLQTHVHVAATHSHSAPDIVGLYGGAPDSYKDALIGAARAAAEEAVARSTSVQLRWAQVSVEGVCMNRRIPAGKADTECTILQCATPAGDVVATMTNLSVHAVCLGPDNQLVTADFVHYLREELEAQFGGVALHFNGTEGNMNPAPQLRSDDRLDRTGGTFAQAQSMGTTIGRTAAGAIAAAPWQSNGALAVDIATCQMPLDNPMFLQAIEAGLLPGELQDGCIEVELGRLDIGPLRLFLIPGEAFAEIGLAIKNWWPDEPVGVVGLCNGLVGYLIPPELYTEGEYEESVCPSSRAWPALEQGLLRLAPKHAEASERP